MMIIEGRVKSKKLNNPVLTFLLLIRPSSALFCTLYYLQYIDSELSLFLGLEF